MTIQYAMRCIHRRNYDAGCGDHDVMLSLFITFLLYDEYSGRLLMETNLIIQQIKMMTTRTRVLRGYL